MVRGIAGVFGLRIVATGLSFVFYFLMARLIGAEGIGTYSFSMTCVSLLGLPAGLGFTQLLIRDIAVYSSCSQWELMKGLLSLSHRVTLVLSFVLSMGVAVALLIWAKNSSMLYSLLIVLIALPVNCLRGLNQSTMSGLHQVVKGTIPDSLITPLSSVLFTGILFVFFKEESTTELLVGIYVLVAVIGLLSGSYQLRKHLPKELNAVKPQYEAIGWVSRSLPFMFLGALYLVNSQADILMIGTLEGIEPVGTYTIASRLASIIVFILTASNAVLSPMVSGLYSSRNMGELQNLITKSSRLVLVTSCGAALVLLLFRDQLLGAFGKDFSAGGTILALLIFGQLINAFSGPVGMLMNMSGYEKQSLIIFLISAVANLLLNFYLIPQFGANGAAMATTVSMVMWNCMGLFWVFNKLNLNSTAFNLAKN